MSRATAGIIEVCGWLQFESPVHVGGMGGDADVDLALAEDGLGRHLIPGTSLAGILRAAHVRTASDEALVRRWWGSIDAEVDGEEGGAGHASRLVVSDGVVLASRSDIERFESIDDALAARYRSAGSSDPGLARPPLEIRDGVGIARHTGAAATGILYTRHVLPVGSVARLHLTMEVATSGELAEATAELGSLVRDLANGTLAIGGSTTRGLGRVRLLDDCTRVTVHNLTSRAGTLAWLTGGGEGAHMTVADLVASATSPALPTVTITVVWWPTGSLLVGSGVEGTALDQLPLVTRTPEGLRPVVPGSSVKGAMRSAAERIVRTVLDRPAIRQDTGRTAFLRQLDELPLVGALFGAAPPEDGVSTKLGRGALAADDCLARGGLLGGGEWDALLATALTPAFAASLEEKGFRPAWHVAIDRWTGGAAPHKLFSALETRAGVDWPPLTLRLDPTRLPAEVHDAALALLVLTLRDLATGRIRIGHGTARGRGRIAVDRIVIEGLPEAGAGPVTLDDVDPEWLARLEHAWRRWIAAELAPAGTSTQDGIAANGGGDHG